jgi:hypothetical protein
VKAVAHWRAPSVEHKEPYPDPDEVVSFLAFHEHGLGYPVHPFLLGLLNEWEVELHNLNPNGVLHIAGFVMLRKGFVEIDPHADLFQTFFLYRSLKVKGDPLPVPVRGFGCRRGPSRWGITRRTPPRIRTGGDMRSCSTSGTRQHSWTWGPPTQRKGRVALL